MRILEPLLTVTMIVFFFFVVFGSFIVNGTITIETPYYNEYTTTQVQLSDCQEALDQKIEAIKCPAVECKPGFNGMIIAVMGTLWGLFGMGMYFYGLWNKGKLEKKPKGKKKS